MKKTIPVSLLKTIEEIYVYYKEYINFLDEENTYYTFIDKDPSSDFFFRIHKGPTAAHPSGNPHYYYYEAKPISDNSTHALNVSCKSTTEVGKQFREWLKRLKMYDQTTSIYDDPFINEYQKYYYSQFEIIEDDADIVPFSPEQQELIDNYLDFVEQKLLEYKDDNNKEDINSFIEETKGIKDSLVSTTKKSFINKLTRLWARIYKWDKSKAKEIIVCFGKEVFKETIKEGIKFLLGT